MANKEQFSGVGREIKKKSKKPEEKEVKKQTAPCGARIDNTPEALTSHIQSCPNYLCKNEKLW